MPRYVACNAALISASDAKPCASKRAKTATLLKRRPMQKGAEALPPSIDLPSCLLLDADSAVVVAVVAARAVQVSTDQVVGVIAVRNAFMSASGTVLMTLIVR